MKKSLVLAFGATVCAAAIAATSGLASPHSSYFLKARTAHGKAQAQTRLSALSTEGGRFDALLVHDSLNARNALLAHGGSQATHKGFRSAAATGSSPLSWTELGPGNVGGRINTIWVDPANALHMIVGAAGGGLWQSLDAGQSWAAVAGFPGTLAIGAFTNVGSTLIAGTGDEHNEPTRGIGLVQSTDGGANWSPMSSTAPSAANPDWYYVTSLSTSSAGVLLASTGAASRSWGGLYRSTDSGQSWTKVWPASGGSVSYQVLFDPNNANVAVADTDGGSVAYSTDAGHTWFAASGLPGSSTPTAGHRSSLAFDSSTPGSVYALVDNNPSGPSGQVYHSIDGGKTWTLLADTSAFFNTHNPSSPSGALCDNSQNPTELECQGNYDNVIAVVPNPGTSPTIYAAGTDIFQSNDGGKNWSETGSWLPPDPNYIHADNHAILSSSQGLYVGNDGGMFKLSAAGTGTTARWTSLNNGLAITQFYAISGHQGVTASHIAPNGTAITPILAGAQDNGTLLYEGYTQGGAPQPNNWVTFYGGDGAGALVDAVDGNALYGAYVYMAISQAYGTTYGHEFRSLPSDAGSAANFIAPMTLVPNGNSLSSQMLAGGASLWRGTGISGTTGNVSPSWVSLNGSTLPVGSAGNYINAISIDPRNNDNVWVGYNDGELWHSANATSSSPTWVQSVSTTLPHLQVTSIWVVPGQSSTVYVTFNRYPATPGNVFVSNDGGTTWQGIGATLPPGPVYTLVTDPNNALQVYVGTYTGVYYSQDGGASWMGSNVGPANVSVNQLSWFATGSQPLLLAATDGRGAWLGAETLNPTPTLTSLSPSHVAFGASDTTFTLSGSGFVNGATVTLDGNAIAASVVSSIQLQVTVPATTFKSAGSHTFVVTNPAPGGGNSAGVAFSVDAPPSSGGGGGGALGLWMPLVGLWVWAVRRRVSVK